VKLLFPSHPLKPREPDPWIIVEIGDGGVSGLTFTIEPWVFYQALKRRVIAFRP
jgi:hypothetical protein